MAAVIAVIILALIFDFLNGINDSSNIVATMISSRAYSPRVALGVAAVAEFCGPFLFGVAVANTIGHDIVDANSISPQVLIAALSSAIFWNFITRYLGLPSSSSHALIGGLVGAVVVAAGWDAIKLQGLQKVLVSLLLSPLLGFIVGFLVMRLTYILCWKATPSINGLFKRGQMVTGVSLALTHGANDAQKTMGIITLALVSGGYLKVFHVPTWVMFICASMIALGTAIGSRRLIRTLGGKFFKIRPVDGFSSQFSAASVILSASLLGGPVSTTQVVSSAIMGVGAAERINKVRWGVAQDIAAAWVLTIPCSALVGALICWISTLLF